MEHTCKWCNKPLTAGFALLCPECKDRMKYNETTAAKAATDQTAGWDWLAPLPVKVTNDHCGDGKVTHIRCPGCHQEVTTPSLEVYDDCPNCGEKLKLRQPGTPDIQPVRVPLQPAWEQPHNRPNKHNG